MKKILLLGANRTNVPGIRSAKQAGFCTLVADPDPNSAGLREADVPLRIDVRDCERLLGLVSDSGGVDGIVSMSEVGIEPAAYMSERLGLPSISQAAAANCRSKAAMRRLWASTRFSTEFAIAKTELEASHIVAKFGLPLIFKPDRSFGGSRGVSRVERWEQISEAFHSACQSGLPETSVVIERCIIGIEHSCEVLIHEGECVVLCIGQKVKSLSPYRVDISVQYPAPLFQAQEETVAAMCRAAIHGLGLTRGAAHVEFTYTAGGPVLFEIGARCGGGHTPEIARAVSGVDEFIAVCRMACGDCPGELRPIQRRGGNYRFLVFPPGYVRSVHIPQDVRMHPRVIDVDVFAKPGQEICHVRKSSDRAGFIVTLGDTYNDASDLADWACKRISVTYVDGSTSSALPLYEFEDVQQ